MKKYRIYKINENGIPKKMMEAHAQNITAMWLGSKHWFCAGTFLITSDDGTETQLFIKEWEK